jgi:hypothetical protein
MVVNRARNQNINFQRRSSAAIGALRAKQAKNKLTQCVSLFRS